MAQIGTLRLQTSAGIVDLPVFEPGDSGGDVIESLRVNTASGVGFIPLADPSEAAYPFLRVQTSQGVMAVHNEASVSPFAEPGETGFMEKFDEYNSISDITDVYQTSNSDKSDWEQNSSPIDYSSTSVTASSQDLEATGWTGQGGRHLIGTQTYHKIVRGERYTTVIQFPDTYGQSTEYNQFRVAIFFMVPSHGDFQQQSIEFRAIGYDDPMYEEYIVEWNDGNENWQAFEQEDTYPLTTGDQLEFEIEFYENGDISYSGYRVNGTTSYNPYEEGYIGYGAAEPGTWFGTTRREQL